MSLAKPTLAAVTLATVLLGWTAQAMAWQVTWLGHAGFLIQAKDGTRVLSDAWPDNPKAPIIGVNELVPGKTVVLLSGEGLRRRAYRAGLAFDGKERRTTPSRRPKLVRRDAVSERQDQRDAADASPRRSKAYGAGVAGTGDAVSASW